MAAPTRVHVSLLKIELAGAGGSVVNSTNAYISHHPVKMEGPL
jgi:hypothetical protein